jgi:hypothetical protein
MTHERSALLAAAIVAGCLSAGAWAADTSTDANAAPTTQNMDNNAQRAHSKGKTAATAKDDAAHSKGMTGGSANAAESQVASGTTRDWAKIDANSDNLIEPDEMQKYLDAQRTDKGSSTPPASQKQ